VPTNNNNDNLLTVGERDQNLNATINTPTPTVESTVPSMLTESAGPATGPYIIKTFKQFKAGLPQQDYKQVESKLDNPTREVLQWHYK
jgi:hypothetical protein